MSQIPTHEDLKKLRNTSNSIDISSTNTERSHVFSDPRDLTYKFIKCRYNNKKRSFNHIEIGKEIFDDYPNDGNDIINIAIKNLNKNTCWRCIDNTNFEKISDCENCKKISG